MEFNVKDILTILPMIGVTVTAFVVIIIEAAFRKSSNMSYLVSIIGLIISIGLAVESLSWRGTSFFDMVNIGGYGNFFSILFMVAAIFSIILSKDYLIKQGVHHGEYYILILFSTVGMMLMASAADMIVIFLGLELMSICLYVLAGFMRKRIKSNEAALKYFLLGAFATGFLLYGMALIYGITETTNIQTIVVNSHQYAQLNLFWVGMGLILIGFAFKVAAVPFHMWVPDVYEGSPTTVTAFMATGAKAAAFAALVMIFAHTFVEGERLKDVLSVLTAASMIIGNIVAISQTNIKRMLAYSSIAHAGYMLVGLAAANELGRSGILFYLTAYTFMNIGAFGILSILEKEEDKNLTFEDYAGLSTKHPFLAAMMAIFMLSFIGIPPFAGFFGKYYVFAAAINANLTWLVIIGVLMSAVSAYYYLRLVVMMYFRESDLPLLVPSNPANNAVLFVSVLLLFGLGIFPSVLLTIINNVFI
ncbi:MAG: NADH-quinone oxidoreductase subunit N [Bacteroidota bacterium]|nr:NADH-quinone oxidoreductase subunit N [Bacteroidota bacterium]